MKTIAISSLLFGSAAALAAPKAAKGKAVVKGKAAPVKSAVSDSFLLTFFRLHIHNSLEMTNMILSIYYDLLYNLVSKFSVESLPGVLPPVGFFDPWNLSAKADEATIKRYRESEIAHGRVGMLAVIGFLVGEKVEGSSFLFDASIKGPAITHITQVPEGFLPLLIGFIGAYEVYRSLDAFVNPSELPVDTPGKLRDDYTPGDLKFDPLNLKPKTPEELFQMQNRELQNGRLAMLAAAGFIAQEGVDGKGIWEHAVGPAIQPDYLL